MKKRKIIWKKMSSKGYPVRQNHVPQRTCVGCRTTRMKGELVRIVSRPSGSVEIDLSKRSPGRGAYLCPRRECWELGLKKDRLGRSLRTKISSEDYQRLVEYSRTFPKGDSG